MRKSRLVLGAIVAMTAVTLAAGVVSVAEEKNSQTEAVTEVVTEADAEDEIVLEDGIYTAVFDTDSGMFHVNEACEEKGVLTVKDGKMTIHVTLAGKGILNLFVGLAEDAEKEDAEILEPTEDEVTYKDGYKEKAYGFDIPVPVIGKEFNVALIGKKEKWYDHKVCVKDPQPMQEAETEDA